MLRRQCNVGKDKGGGGPPRARDVFEDRNEIEEVGTSLG